MCDDTHIRAEGRRIWPDAKRLVITQDGGATITAFNYEDELIDVLSADSMELLAKRLRDVLPEGGQAP
jgi:hypothetical protein